MTSDAVRELEEKNEALRTRIVTAHAERDSALALVHARTVNLDAMRTDRDAAVKRAEEAEAKLVRLLAVARSPCSGGYASGIKTHSANANHDVETCATHDCDCDCHGKWRTAMKELETK